MEVTKIEKRVIVSSIEQVNSSDWNKISDGKNIYLTLEYLKSLESAMKNDMKFFYAISYDQKGSPVVLSSFQIVQFTDKRKAASQEACIIGSQVKKKFKDVFQFNMLVSGNVFADGENGFIFSESISPKQAIKEVEIISEELKEEWKVKDQASITLFKEFWPKSTIFSDILTKNSYREFMIDVNMVLDIYPSWNTMQDYLDSMTTKYRTRVKSVYKKSDKLQIKSFSSHEIETNKDIIQELFGNVLSKAEFSYGVLKVDAFVNFKKSLGENFSFRAFYLQDELIGFSTAIFNQGGLEAAYVGLDYENNQKYAVYQRMLYDYVEQALELNAKNLQLGRTAELIKSAIGAVPTNMRLYVKHRKTFPNLLLKPIIRSISPREFELRQPFKANFIN